MDIKSVNRRAILKLLPALPFAPHLIVNGDVKAGAVQLAPRFIVMFFDELAVDLNQLLQTEIPVPGLEIELVPLRLRHGQKLEDAVKIFEVTKQA